MIMNQRYSFTIFCLLMCPFITSSLSTIQCYIEMHIRICTLTYQIVSIIVNISSSTDNSNDDHDHDDEPVVVEGEKKRAMSSKGKMKKTKKLVSIIDTPGY